MTCLHCKIDLMNGRGGSNKQFVLQSPVISVNSCMSFLFVGNHFSHSLSICVDPVDTAMMQCLVGP